jgi:hypothetical protein
MDKAELLHTIREIVEKQQESADVQVRMSADNIMRTLIICAAGMDERFEELTRELGSEAAVECMMLDFGGQNAALN